MITFNIATAIPSKKMLSRPVPPCLARARRAVVAAVTRTNRPSLPVMHPGEPTSPPPTGVSSSEPLSNNQNSPMSPEAVRDLMAKNPKLPGSVVIYLTNNEELQDKLMELKEIVQAGATITSSRELAASMASLGQAEDLIVLVYPNQLKMQQKEQSNGDTLVAKLKDIGWRQDTYHTFFTSSTTVSGLVAFTSGQIIAGKLAVVLGVSAAAVAISFFGVGKRVDSHEDELKKPVKECKGISNAITKAHKLEQRHLEEIMASIGDLKSDNQSIQAMMVAPEAAQLSDEIDGKVAALKLRYQRLLAKVDWGIRDTKSARKAVHHPARGACQQHLASPENWI